MTREAIQFASRLVELITRAETTTSYKYALLIALIELSIERRGGGPVVTTRRLAERVLELYWPQSRPYQPERVLCQLNGRGRSLVDLIVDFRAANPGETGTPARAAALDPTGYAALVDQTEWLLVRNPLPRLQRLGGETLQLIYEISWNENVTENRFVRYRRLRDGTNDPPPLSEFDIRLTLAAENWLVDFAPLFLPLIRREWASFVARANRDVIGEATLEQFLFEFEREQVSKLCDDIAHLQGQRCFYCEARLDGRSQVDHFLAWSRCGVSSVENLVVAHDGCNNSKSDYLVAPEHLQRWTQRLIDRRAELHALAAGHRWPTEPERVGALVRSSYVDLTSDVRLWLRRKHWVPAARGELEPINERLGAWLQTVTG